MSSLGYTRMLDKRLGFTRQFACGALPPSTGAAQR
jgi:hypothetical protein